MPPTKQSTKRYPYMLRGRVEVAVFNCPFCNDILKFRARTTFRKKCPTCQTMLYVFLRVCVSRGPSPSGVRPGERPVDTILPVPVVPVLPVLPVVLTPADPATPTPTPSEHWMATQVRERRQLNAIQHTLEGEPRSQVRPGPAKMLGYQPAGDDVDQFVAELGDGAIEPLPQIGLGKWQPGELAHRLVDLDELREQGGVLEIERPDGDRD